MPIPLKEPDLTQPEWLTPNQNEPLTHSSNVSSCHVLIFIFHFVAAYLLWSLSSGFWFLGLVLPTQLCRLTPKTWWPTDPAVLAWGLSEHGSPHLLPSLCHAQISAFPWLLLGSGIPMGALDKIYHGLGLVIRKFLPKP